MLNSTLKNSIAALCAVFTLALCGTLHAQQEKTPITTALITIDETIDSGLAIYVKSATNEAIARGASTIIYKVDTFGGRVDSALEICDIINTVPEEGTKPKTIAWVNTRAISAGALISMSCDEIVMTEGAQIGDCQPIVGGGGGAPTPAGEKIETVLRSQFRSFARRNGYSKPLSEAFVDQSIEVYSFEYDGKKVYLSKQEYEDLPAIKKARYLKKRTVIAEGKLLTIDNIEALEMGFSKANLQNIDELKKHYQLAEITEVAPSWSEQMTRYLTSAGISSLILIIGLVAMWTEFKAPGFGVPGLTAIACFALLLGARYLSGLAEMPYILMVAAGLLLICIELFLIPGTMFCGTAGFILFIAGLFLSFTGGTIIPSTPLESEFVYTQMQILLGSFAASIALFLVIARYLPEAPIFKALALQTTLEENVCGSSDESRSDMIGQIGTAVTDLRPSGKIKVGEKIIDVVSDSSFINNGKSVKIIAQNITHFTVEQIEADENTNG